MTESEFLSGLYVCINDEPKLGHLGHCDWIEPKRYRIGGIGSAIEGKIGFVTPDPIQFKLIIYLPEQIKNLDDMPWSELIPTTKFYELCSLVSDTFEIDLTT